MWSRKSLIVVLIAMTITSGLIPQLKVLGQTESWSTVEKVWDEDLDLDVPTKAYSKLTMTYRIQKNGRPLVRNAHARLYITNTSELQLRCAEKVNLRVKTFSGLIGTFIDPYTGAYQLRPGDTVYFDTPANFPEYLERYPEVKRFTVAFVWTCQSLPLEAPWFTDSEYKSLVHRFAIFTRGKFAPDNGIKVIVREIEIP